MDFKERLLQKHQRMEMTLREMDENKKMALEKIQRSNFEIERQVREKMHPKDIYKEIRLNITLQESLSPGQSSKGSFFKAKVRKSLPRNLLTGMPKLNQT